jgi:transposase
VGSFRCLGSGVRDPVGQVAGLDGLDRQLDHPCPPACEGGEDHAIGRSRGGLSTKINAVVDENGLPIQLMLTAGQTHEMRTAPQLLAGLKCRHVVADRGYDADALLVVIRASGAKTHILSTSQRLIHRSVNRRIHRQRNLIERFLCKLNHSRRIDMRFDKLARNFLAAVALASTRLWMRAYESST